MVTDEPEKYRSGVTFADGTTVHHRKELDAVQRELLSRSAEEYRQSPGARRSLTAGLKQLRGHARELATQDARELVERFGQLGRRKLQLAV